MKFLPSKLTSRLLACFFAVALAALAEATNTVESLTMEEVAARVEQERENVRLSRESERRLQERMRELMAEDDPDGALIREYAEYLEKLEAIREEHERALAEMEAALSQRTDAEDTHTSAADEDNSDMEFKIPDEGDQSTRIDDLEKALQESVEDFDRFLHKEQEGVEYKVRQISEASGKRVGALKSAAEDKRDALLKRGEKLPDQPKAAKTAEAPKEPNETSGSEKTTSAKPPESGPLKGKSPETEPVPDRNPQTDDVVARQLREAAEEETDPELRRRLWAEYDDYKAGIE